MHCQFVRFASFAVVFISAALLIAADAPRKTNVLFIAVDDLRPELACYGQSHMRTPNIDRLAAQGVVFERAYCQQAVCNPSRASLLSGCRPETTKVVANNQPLRKLMPDVLTLPQHFKNHGYHTASVGKIFHHSATEPGDDPLAWSEPSFYNAPRTKSWHTPESLEVIRRRPQELAAAGKPTNAKAARRGPPFEAADVSEDMYPDGGIAERAIETLRRVKNQPFFLGVGFLKPHLPFCCPRKYFDLYPASGITLAANGVAPVGAPEAALHNWYELRTYGTVPLSGLISDELALNMIRAYRACVSFVDAQVGRVLDELERLELAENTVVVFFGDHGYHLGENGVWTKMTNFELGTRVPLIVRVPGISAGQRTAALVELVDLYPTLAEVCGLSQPEHLEGTSLVPLLKEPARAWKSAVFSEYTRPGGLRGRTVRSARYRYTEWTDANGESQGCEFYDHQDDPQENRNLVDDAGQRTAITEHEKLLQAGWRAAVP